MKYKKIIFVSLLFSLISLMCIFVFAQGVGYIQIKCEPGAIVFLDNNFVGNTSSELGGLILQDVPAGSHEIKIVKEGSEPQSVKIDLKANEIYVYEVFLKQISGSLLIETLPIDCIIEIPLLNIDKKHNGNKTEKTWEVFDIPIGNYRINFIALGKKVKYDLKIEEGVKKHLLVNILKNEVKEIVPVLTWDKTYGGSAYDRANSLIQTADGGYAVAGYTKSKGAGDYDDFWVIKLDEQGNQVWDKTYGASLKDQANSLIQTTDGGYAVVGQTESVVGYTKSVGAGGFDFWVIKLDEQGNQVWDKTYGGSNNDWANSLIQTTDGGYAVAGPTKSKGAGVYDFWVIKLDKRGKIVWDKTYGGSAYDWAESLIQTTDGGYAVAGSTKSKGAGDYDFWVIKLDTRGKIVWDKTYGGSAYDWANSLIQTADGGYAVAGVTTSKGAGGADFWIIKLDEQGNQVWDKTYGGSGGDGASSLIQTTDGGYAVAGYTYSKGAGKEDFWVIKLDEKGNLIPGVSKLDYEAETGTESNIPSIQSFKVPTFNSYKWEVGIPGFAKPGEITKFKDTTISTVQLSSPSNGATLPLGGITFSWNSVSNATKYQFILYNRRGQVALDTTKDTTSLTISLAGGEGTITWKVRAGDNSGNWGTWSSLWSLTLKFATIINSESPPEISETAYFLTGSLHCPNKRGYPCNSCSSSPGYINHFKGFNVLTTNEDCYVKLVYQNGTYIGNQNNSEVTVKGDKWLGLENELGTKLVEEINKGNFDFKPANKFVERTMNFPDDNYKYEFANEGKEFQLYLSKNREEAFKAVPWQNIVVEIKNKETDKVFKYKFQKGIFPLTYSWSNGVANYGQCVWWVAKRWVEEVDPVTLFPFYPPSPQDVNVIKIDSNYQPKRFDILIDYKPGELGHYGFVEKVDGNKVYITQFNFILPGEVYNYILRAWNGNATNLFYSGTFDNRYYFKYYYRK